MSAEAPAGEIPIFPLRTVLFPGGMLPLRVFEARYMDMARNALRTGSAFGVCLISEGREVGEPAVPVAVGTLANIVACDMEQLGLLLLKTRGLGRFRITSRRTNAQGLILARAEPLDEEPDAPLAAQHRPFAELLRRVIAEAQSAPFWEPHELGSARWVSHRVSEILPLPLPVKQSLLEMLDGAARLDALERLLRAQGISLQ
jgi:Lon protease-like protein